MMFEFALPDLGENISAGTVSKILVAVGDTVSKGQNVLEIETDKAVAEIPVTAGGKIVEIRIFEGRKVSAGQILLVLDTSVALDASSPSPTPASTLEQPKQRPIPQPFAPPQNTESSSARGAVRAAPSIRKLARDHQINIDQIAAKDPSGRVTAQDVMDYIEQQSVSTPSSSAENLDVSAEPAGSLSSRIETAVSKDRWGPVEQEPMSAIRQKAAIHLTHCWTTIAHVTHFDKADITDLEAFRRRHALKLEKQGTKLTITAFIVKLLPEALKRFPRFNASVDMVNQSILLKRYYNIGVAVDTPHGLVVPVLRNVDGKKVMEISQEMTELSQKARDRKLTLPEMQGGTFSVSNLGGVGGHGFTPIINAPEVAILGMSRAQVEPIYIEQAWQPRLMLPLCLSYDHRIIDGADAARFLRFLVDTLSQPWGIVL